MIASAWSSAVATAGGVFAVLVLGLLRAYWRLSERVARLEGRLNGRRAGE